MGYKCYDTAQGTFSIDWDTCCLIIRSYERAKLQDKHSKVTTESQSSRFNPLSWGLPDLSYVEVDWDKVRWESQANTMSTAYWLAAIAMFESNGVDKLVRKLQTMQKETEHLNKRFRDRMRRASGQSMAAIEASVGNYQTAVDVAKFVRDTSGSILIGAASVMSGGAAAAATAGMGTVVKTVGKYQDTGNAGVASIEAAQQIVCAVIPGAKQVKMDLAVKVVIATGADTGKTLLEGHSLATAIETGAVNVPVGLAGEAAKKALGPILGDTVVPIVVKIAEDQSKKVAQRWVKSRGGPASMTHDAKMIVSGGSGLAEQMSVTDDLLLKLAVVDMNKGVGRSWW